MKGWLPAFAGLVLLVALSPAWGQPADSPPTDSFSLESLTLKSGARYEGLVLTETDQQLEFAEIVRPPGKRMYAIVRAVPQREVALLKRLEPKQKEAAEAWFERFRRQADFAAAQAESVLLNRDRIDGVLGWNYSGRWFDLWSTADEASTRRVIVRLEQLFLAFRQVLPPRVTPAQPPRVLIYGHRDEYRDQLREWGLTVNNPAFYASTQHTIVASCPLGQITRHAEQVAREQKDFEDRLKKRNAEFNLGLVTIAGQMRQRGFPAEEVTAEIRARRSQWESEQKDEERRFAEVQRHNKQQLEEATAAFFRRLAHEAFHAYAENFVFPAEEGRMPRWLNEGLAQIFEAAPLDVDHLRIDAPDPARKAALRAELNSRRPPSVASVLTADEEQFTQAHDRDEMDRLYLYSWGVAWQVIFTEPVVRAEQVDQYLALAKAESIPVKRFEKLVGQPLAEWEAKWREKWK